MRIYNGVVWTMEGRRFERGYVDFEGRRIVALGDMAGAPAHRGEEFDANGGYIVPGFVDAHSHIGLSEEGNGPQGEDCNENTDPVTPQMRAMDGIYPFDVAIHKAASAGVTSALVSPGSNNVIGGQICAIKLAGNNVDAMLIKTLCGMKCATGENPKRYYGERHEKTPMTRMAIASLIREALNSAKRYMQKKGKGDDVYDPKCEALIPVLTREIPAHFHAHRSDDMLTALRICKEFSIRGVLVHATESKAIIPWLKEADMPVILGPSFGPSSKLETRAGSFDTAKTLCDAGVEFSITTDHDVEPLQYLSVMAALSAREGLDLETALRAITILPAKIGGIDDRVGSLKVGKDADISVFSGHPLDFLSTTRAVFIDGCRIK